MFIPALLILPWINFQAPKAAAKKAAPVKANAKAPAKKPVVEESSEEDSSDEVQSFPRSHCKWSLCSKTVYLNQFHV